MAADEPSQIPVQTLVAKAANPFSYAPLRQDVDSIRLVRIHPRSRNTAPIECEMIHVAFKDKPKFEALSYMWGDDTIKFHMLLNGQKFAVGKNLLDGLLFLQNRAKDELIWIDAMCINQNNVDERNKQLRMMPHIYFRATAVVIWLGKQYETLQQMKGPQSNTARVGPPSAFEMTPNAYHSLLQDGYWDRLWIVQELGLARAKQVCFGKMELSWEMFLETMKGMYKKVAGLEQLVTEVEHRYTKAHTFRRLLFDHQNALCKDPKDKIYALLGLAIDARGFPVDYNKSLMEIWIDTMEFMNERELFETHERESGIIEVGTLVKYLLTTPNASPQLQMGLQDPSSRIIDGDSRTTVAKVFHIVGYAVGRLVSVGPTVGEITSSMERADAWTLEVSRNFRRTIANAHKESVRLLDAVLNLDESDFEPLGLNHVSRVGWSYRTPSDSSVIYDHYVQWNRVNKARETPKSLVQEAKGECAMFQLHHFEHGEIPWKMGVTTDEARPGDILCWIREGPKAVIVRATPVASDCCTMRVVGAALVTDDVVALNDPYRRVIGHVDHNKRLRMFDDPSEKMMLKVDAETIFRLIVP